MKKKLNGFTYIECIVSLSIIATLVSLIYISLYGSYSLTDKNSKYNRMLNEAKTKLDDTKYIVSTSNDEAIPEYYEVLDKENYTVKTKLEKIEKYYGCYKIDVEVEADITSIKLSSYVTQQ